MRKGRIILGFAGILGLTAAACNGLFLGGLGGSSTAPAAFLPTDVTLDISELPDSDTAGAKVINSAAAITGTVAYDRTLRASGAILHAFHRVARKSLALGAVVRDDFTSPDQTQVSGKFMADGQEVSYRADFAAFDFDGDGQADGSGSAGVEPVAMRMWVDRGNGFERFLAALVTVRPTTANLGVGEMVFKPGAARAASFQDLQVRMMWNRTDPAHKWNEAFVSGQIRQAYSMSTGHQRVDVRTMADGSIEKTVRSTSNFTASPAGFDTYSFWSHYRRGSGVVLMSGQSTGGTAQVSFDNICVSLTDFSLDTTGGCDNLDTSDNTFLDTPTGNETDFPADFPATPTFTPTTTATTTTTVTPVSTQSSP